VSVLEQQRFTALSKANEIRLHRAELRREVKGLGQQSATDRVVELLTETPGWLESLAVGDLLLWIHSWGTTRMERTCRRLGFVSSARVAGPVQSPNWNVRGPVLSERQRLLLVGWLEDGRL
jgi:hypothetical protein